MPRKKNKDQKPTPETSAMKRRMSDLALENDMMEKAIKRREENLKRLRAIQADEALALANQDPEDDPPPPPPGMLANRRRFHIPQEGEDEGERAGEFERTLADFSSTDGRVEVYRYRDNTYAKVGSFPAKEWGDSLEGIAKRFGGGTFKVELRDPNGTFAGKTIVHFDEDAYPKPSAKTVEPVSNNIEILRIMQENSDRNSQQMMTMLTTMMTTLASSLGNKQNLISNINELASFKDLFGPKTVDDDEKAMKFLKMFETGMSMGKKLTPGESGEGSFLGGLLREVLSGENGLRLTEMLKSAARPAPGNGNGGRRAAPAPAPGSRPPALPPDIRPNPLSEPAGQPELEPQPQPEERQEHEPMPQPDVDVKTKMMIAMYRPILFGHAQKNADPETVAEMILKRISSDDFLLIVDDAIQSPVTKELWVYSFAPELRDYDKWVGLVMAAMSRQIREMFVDDNASEGQPDGQPAEAQVETGMDSGEGEQK